MAGLARLHIEHEAGGYFDVDCGSGLGELRLHGLGLVFRDALFDVDGGALDEILRLFQPERGDLANGLDDVDLVCAEVGEDNGELSLLSPRRALPAQLLRRRRAAAMATGAAAVTPKVSSIALLRSRSSRIVMPLMTSRTC